MSMNVPFTSTGAAETNGGLSYRQQTSNAERLLATSIDGANDAGKLWLPIWSGEVLHAYDEYRMFEPMVTSKSIDSGRTIEFPMTGKVGLKPAWGAGEYLVGGDDSVTETFTIELDKRPMAAHFELDNVDLMITQWEYRQELARQAGQTLANARDKQIGAFLALAGCAQTLDNDPRDVAFPDVFQDILLANPNSDAALKILEAIEDYCVDLQENDVPVGPTYCAVSPRLFQQIRRLGIAEVGGASGDVTNMQPMFGGVAAAGGLGAQFTQGMNALSDSLTYMGVTIIKTNHMPADYTAAGASIGEDRYNVDGVGAGLKAIMWQPEAVASVRKTGLVVDTEDDIRRNTTFTVASMMSGTGILKPELVKLAVDNTVSLTAANTTAAEIDVRRGEIEAVLGTGGGYVSSNA